MSAFQVSITDPSTGLIKVTGNCTTLTLFDTSNYIGNTTPGCGISLFNHYRTFSVQYYQGSLFNLSSLTNPPTCTAASSGVESYSITINTGDGFYLYTLTSLPDWTTGVAYVANQSQVYNVFDGKIYTCITSHTSTSLLRPDLTPLDWVVATSVFSQFQASGYFALTCNAAVCIPTKIADALCSNPNFPCDNTTLCNNPAFLDAIKSMMLLYSINTANSLNQLQFTTNTFNLLNEICGCTSGQ